MNKLSRRGGMVDASGRRRVQWSRFPIATAMQVQILPPAFRLEEKMNVQKIPQIISIEEFKRILVEYDKCKDGKRNNNECEKCNSFGKDSCPNKNKLNNQITVPSGKALQVET